MLEDALQCVVMVGLEDGRWRNAATTFYEGCESTISEGEDWMKYLYIDVDASSYPFNPRAPRSVSLIRPFMGGCNGLV